MEKMTESEFINALGECHTKRNLVSLSPEEIYAACYDVIERAAELYSELYNIEKDELIGEANLCFMEYFESTRDSKVNSTGKYVQKLKRRLNSHLYDYCERNTCDKYEFVSLQETDPSTRDDEIIKALSGGIMMGILNTLSSVQERILYARYYQELTYKDIGDELGMDPTSVRHTEVRALMRLRRDYNKRKTLMLLLEQFG